MRTIRIAVAALLAFPNCLAAFVAPCSYSVEIIITSPAGWIPPAFVHFVNGDACFRVPVKNGAEADAWSAQPHCQKAKVTTWELTEK